MTDIGDLTDLEYSDTVVVDGRVTQASFWNSGILKAIKDAVNIINAAMLAEIGADDGVVNGTIKDRLDALRATVDVLDTYVDQAVTTTSGPSFHRVVLGDGANQGAHAASRDYVAESILGVATGDYGWATDVEAIAGTETRKIIAPSNLKAAVDNRIEDAIVDGETDKAPTQNAVYDGLHLKLTCADPAFTGTLTGPAATYTGDVCGCNGVYAGSLNAVNGVFSGNVSGVDGCYSGNVYGACFCGTASGNTVAGSCTWFCQLAVGCQSFYCEPDATYSEILHMGQGASVLAKDSAGDILLSQGAKYSCAGWLHQFTGAAGGYFWLVNGCAIFSTATAGTAGETATFTERFRVNNAGDVSACTFSELTSTHGGSLTGSGNYTVLCGVCHAGLMTGSAEWGLIAVKNSYSAMYYNGTQAVKTVSGGACTIGVHCGTTCIESPIICGTSCGRFQFVYATGSPYIYTNGATVCIRNLNHGGQNGLTGETCAGTHQVNQIGTRAGGGATQYGFGGSASVIRTYVNTSAGAWVSYSTNMIKQDFSRICITECIRKARPVVYSYTYNQVNDFTAYAIGPMAEDISKTFPEMYYGEDPTFLPNLGNAAFGLGMENMERIDNTKIILKELYSCIAKLETKIDTLQETA